MSTEQPVSDKPETGGKEMSFWDHIDELRKTLFRAAIVVVVLMGVVFCFKDFVFGTVIFGPTSSDFVLYRWLCSLGEWLNMPDFCPEPFKIQVMNLEFGGQFFTHMSVSFWLGFLLGFPYLVYEIWRFVCPALYPNEKRHFRFAFGLGAFLFFCGVAVGYFIIFPLTLHFLGTYEVDPSVPTIMALDKYIGGFTWMILIMGMVFQLPMLALILSKLGVIDRKLLRKFRKHALVLTFVLAAIITPSGDAFTMLMTAFPILLLYQVSIWMVRKGS